MRKKMNAKKVQMGMATEKMSDIVITVNVKDW